MNKRLAVLIATLVVISSVLLGCGSKDTAEDTPESASQVAFTMGTVARITANGNGASEAVEAVIQELERLTAAVDRFTPGSDIHSVNAGAGDWVDVKAETVELVERSLELARLTDGAFDPTVAPLINLWGFIEDPNAEPDEGSSPTILQGQRPPEHAAIEQTLQIIGYEFVEVDPANSKVRLTHEKAELDVGGIAKGYGADRALALFKEHGIDSGLIDLGGDMFVVGRKPDGSEWRIGVVDPQAPGTALAVLSLSDKAVVTSGNYERYFEYEGVRYTHLVDPRTGYPQQELASVTVVAPTGTQADALATAVSILGMEKGLELIEGLPGVDGILIGTNGHIEITAGIKDKVELRGVDT